MATDDGSGIKTVEYSLDNEVWIAESSVTVENNCTVYFKVTDNAGNENIQNVFVTKIDTDAPVLNISRSTESMTNQDVTLSVTAQDDASGIQSIEYSFDNSSWTSGDSVTVGSNKEVSFRITDKAGNKNEKTILINNIDKSNPEIPDKITVNVARSRATVGWQECKDYGVADIKGYYIRYGQTEHLEGNGIFVEANSITLQNLEFGTWNYQLAAMDNAGNISGWSKMQKFEVEPYSPDKFYANEHNLVWDMVPGAAGYTIEYSKDNFKTFAVFESNGNGINVYYLPEGQYQCRVKVNGEEMPYSSSNVLAVDYALPPKKVVSNKDGKLDLFFANSYTVWGSGYSAQHVGIKNVWEGTPCEVSLTGKNKIEDIFAGADANVLILSDTDNGDALFVDDIYTALPERVAAQQARISQIDEIRAGAGDDVVDMTSQRFDYVGDGVKIYGGLGNDTIWANKGNNSLFGDAGHDNLVGGVNDDVLVGGSGNDRMHGGGGNDIFCFGGDWGSDTVEQLGDSKVTLWFESGDMSCWDESTLTYTDGTSKVTVIGVSADKIALKFGDDDSLRYDELADAGCFGDAASEKIFEDKNKGSLA